MRLSYVMLDEVPSTNTYVKEHAGTLANGTVVYTPCQTAGRGWATNRWESEPGKNLSFTLLFKPAGLPAANQWLVSEGVATGLINGIESATGINDLMIKWPNDIYADDRKLAGILIENTVEGGLIKHSVIGVGLNVNQWRFVSDAPNPVSLCQLLAERQGIRPDETALPLDSLLRAVTEAVATILDTVDQTATDGRLPMVTEVSHMAYMRRLYRNDGEPHDWEDREGRRFQAIIRDVTTDGHLELENIATRQRHQYGFKEVAQILPSTTN